MTDIPELIERLLVGVEVVERRRPMSDCPMTVVGLPSSRKKHLRRKERTTSNVNVSTRHFLLR